MTIIVEFPGPRAGRTETIFHREPEEQTPKKVDWRSRERIQQDIDAHIAARRAYGKAVVWEIAAEDENLPAAQLEEAGPQTARAYTEMHKCAHHLLVVLPTDGRALVDLLLYFEKNFTILPQELCGRSLAFDLLRTMRLSLRKSEGYGKC